MGEYTSKYTGEEIDNLLGEVENGEIYSTEEQVVGTWIDGKPLYRKVYVTDITATSTVKSTILENGFANNKVLINVGGTSICTDLAGYHFPIGMYNSAAASVFKFVACVDNSSLKIEYQWSVTQHFRIEVIVEYTKTTD
jgi:hypothetical protein